MRGWGGDSVRALPRRRASHKCLPFCDAAGSGMPQPPPASYGPGRIAAGGIYGGLPGWRGVLLCGEGFPVTGGHAPLPQLFLLVALECSLVRMSLVSSHGLTSRPGMGLEGGLGQE